MVCLPPVGELEEKRKQEKWGREEKWRKHQGKGVTASNVFGRLLFQTRGDHGDVVLRGICLYQGLRRRRRSGDGFSWV